MSFKFTSNNANSSCVPMMTIGSNQNSNIIGYVCQNKNIEHFSESSNYNVSSFPANSYASFEHFGNSNIEHFATTFMGLKGQKGTVDCGTGSSNVVESVTLQSYDRAKFNRDVARANPKIIKTIPCNNQKTCSTIVNDTIMGGDPAPGAQKIYHMTANCVPPIQSFGNTNIEHFGAIAYGKEGERGLVDCGYGSGGVNKVVDSADITYSDAGYKSAYAYTKKNIPCNKQWDCSAVINNTLMGKDPSPGRAKKFTMQARCVNK